ncbi:MAG TPA: CehA/McbA family metallohydrolase [Leptolinea sp.]
MEEISLNLHMHTIYSDGSGTHEDIARAACQCGLDAVIVTDHNVLVDGKEGYYTFDGRRVLVLVGEEVHNQARYPQKNHLLVFGTNREMATFAADLQILLDQVRSAGGSSFIAHPIDPPLPLFGEGDISWEDWSVNGFTGIELWNGFSELKSVITGRFSALWYAFFPQFIANGPLIPTLKKWDVLLATGRRVNAVCGSDAHALHKTFGPLHKTIFPYDFHFKTINNHLLLPGPLRGDLAYDRGAILTALAKGNNFIGYDLPAASTGFRFSANNRNGNASMGDEIFLEDGVTLQIRLPETAELHLLCDGKVIREWIKTTNGALTTTTPGVYRVEVYKQFLGKRRGWIFSNPIYIRANPLSRRSRGNK